MGQEVNQDLRVTAINGYAEYEGNNLLLVSVRVKYMIYLFGMGRI